MFRCYLTNLLLEVSHCLELEYLLFGTHTKKIASGGIMPIPYPLVFLMVVKQSGILSSILFNVYMGDLSVSSNSYNIGGQIENIFLNNLCYADDQHKLVHGYKLFIICWYAEIFGYMFKVDY